MKGEKLIMSKEKFEVPESVSTLVMIFAFFAGIYGVFDQYGNKIKYFLFCVFIFLVKLALVLLAGWVIYKCIAYLWKKWLESRKRYQMILATAEETSVLLGNFQVKTEERLKSLLNHSRTHNYEITELQKQVAGLRDWTGLTQKEEQDRLEEEARKKLEQALNESSSGS